MGKKKKRGHYCIACGRSRPNEKFGGKGHRQHLCKDCKSKGKKAYNPSTPEYDRECSRLSKAIKNCVILYTEELDFFLFQYQNERYITTGDFWSEVFVYHPNEIQKFASAEFLQVNDALQEVLFKKYDETMENGLILDYDDVMENEEHLDISKKRRQYLEVIVSLKTLV
ncbi:hypothetical protein [Lentibacillus salicampi]|uniref:Uncharacterized protein n=1 Tax=Lentibacillus salicampi TaxID=175306 RepID=A0A4Y9AEE6_9BACI|nr:hypothetical protein [Lentibacillus salicampi]TFJ92751.1 hypothetical protein E4U82_10725 [Lentibacillus salicampi]